MEGPIGQRTGMSQCSEQPIQGPRAEGLEDSHFANRDHCYMDGRCPDPSFHGGTVEEYIYFQRLGTGSQHDTKMTLQALGSVVSMGKIVVL